MAASAAGIAGYGELSGRTRADGVHGGELGLAQCFVEDQLQRPAQCRRWLGMLREYCLAAPGRRRAACCTSAYGARLPQGHTVSERAGCALGPPLEDGMRRAICGLAVQAACACEAAAYRMGRRTWTIPLNTSTVSTLSACSFSHSASNFSRERGRVTKQMWARQTREKQEL